MTQVAYGWIVQRKVIPKREVQWPKLPMRGRSNVKSSPRGKDIDQSRLRMEDRPKVTYGWTVQHKVIPKREGQWPKSPMGGQTTKVTYGWTVERKVIPKREGQRPKSPTGGWSNVKSSSRGKDNDKNCLWVDGRPKSLMGGQSKVKSYPRGKNDQSHLWVDGPK